MADGIKDLVKAREEKLAREMAHESAPYNPWPDVYRAADRGATWLDQQLPHVNPGRGTFDENMQWHDPQMENLERVTALGLMGIDPGARAAPGTAGMFYGRKAATANPETFAKGEDMLSRGVSSRDIWNATPEQRLHYADPSENLMFERSDIDSRLKNVGIMDYLKSKVSGKPMTVKDVLDHPELYQNYPHLADIQLKPYLANPRKVRGWYDDRGATESIGLNYLGPDKHTTLLHELQHAIQEHEGWVGGTSPDWVKGKAAEMLDFHNQDLSDIQEAQKLIKEAKDPRELLKSKNSYVTSSPERLKEWEKATQGKINKWTKVHENPHTFYQSAVGEAYARHAPDRGLTADQKWLDKSYPLEADPLTGREIGGYKQSWLTNPKDIPSYEASGLHDMYLTESERPTTDSIMQSLNDALGTASKWSLIGGAAAHNLTRDTPNEPSLGDMQITNGGITNLLQNRR